MKARQLGRAKGNGMGLASTTLEGNGAVEGTKRHVRWLGSNGEIMLTVTRRHGRILETVNREEWHSNEWHVDVVSLLSPYSPARTSSSSFPLPHRPHLHRRQPNKTSYLTTYPPTTRPPSTRLTVSLIHLTAGILLIITLLIILIIKNQLIQK